MSAQSDEFDVVVAGAGMTGATLALALAQAGLSRGPGRPAAAGGAPGAEFDGRASAIAYANFRQWRALGLAEALRAAGPAASTRILVTDGPAPGRRRPRAAGRAFLRFDADEIADRDDGEPLGWMVENRHIRAALAQALRTPASRSSPRAGRRRGRRTAPAPRCALADGRTLSAPLVVGRRGPRARPCARRRHRRHRLALSASPAWSPPSRWRPPHDGVAHQYFMPGGPLAILPLTGDRASLVWTEAARPRPGPGRGSAPRPSRPTWRAASARRWAARGCSGPRFVHPLACRSPHAMTGPRIALVGDAAHAIHPIAGQGLNMGLKDAAALAEVVVDAAPPGRGLGLGGRAGPLRPLAPLRLRRPGRWPPTPSPACSPTATRVTRSLRGAGLALVNRIGPPRGASSCARRAARPGDLPRLLRGEALAPPPCGGAACAGLTDQANTATPAQIKPNDARPQRRSAARPAARRPRTAWSGVRNCMKPIAASGSAPRGVGEGDQGQHRRRTAREQQQRDRPASCRTPRRPGRATQAA